MQVSHFGLLGTVGILVCLAGGHLLWNDRRLIAVWMRELSRVLRGQLAGSQAAAMRRGPGGARAEMADDEHVNSGRAAAFAQLFGAEAQP